MRSTKGEQMTKCGRLHGEDAVLAGAFILVGIAAVVGVVMWVTSRAGYADVDQLRHEMRGALASRDEQLYEIDPTADDEVIFFGSRPKRQVIPVLRERIEALEAAQAKKK